MLLSTELEGGEYLCKGILYFMFVMIFFTVIIISIFIQCCCYVRIKHENWKKGVNTFSRHGTSLSTCYDVLGVEQVIWRWKTVSVCCSVPTQPLAVWLSDVVSG